MNNKKGKTLDDLYISIPSKVKYDGQWDVAHNVALELLDARLDRGWSQKKLADKMGTHQSVVARAEAGSQAPSTTFLNKAAKAMGYVLEIAFRERRTLKSFEEERANAKRKYARRS